MELESSMWEQVVSMVPRAEVDELRRMVGTSTVSRHEELVEELRALQSILSALREENDALSRSRSKSSNTSRMGDPAARALLEKQVRSLVRAIQAREEAEGGVIELPSELTSPRAQAVLASAVTKSSSKSSQQGNTVGMERPASRMGKRRPESAMSKETSSSVASEWSSRSVALAEWEGEDEEEANGSLRRLQNSLQAENAWILAEIDWIQSCLDDEAAFRDGVEAYAPDSLQQKAVPHGEDNGLLPSNQELASVAAVLSQALTRPSTASKEARMSSPSPSPSPSPSVSASPPSSFSSSRPSTSTTSNVQKPKAPAVNRPRTSVVKRRVVTRTSSITQASSVVGPPPSNAAATIRAASAELEALETQKAASIRRRTIGVKRVA